MPPDQQHLIFVGNTLEGGRTLLDYGLKDKDCLFLVVYLGRFWGCLVDVSEDRAVQALPRSREVPCWRACTAGLNVEGKCANGSCRASGQIVVDRKGMVSWSFIADQAHCPVCKQQFQPITCGFVDCVWAFDGRKVSNGVAVEDAQGGWHKADGHQYYRFQEHRGDASWQMLVLTAKSAYQWQPEPSICSICWFVSNDNKDTASCGHCFHPACLAMWQGSLPNAACPMCNLSS